MGKWKNSSVGVKHIMVTLAQQKFVKIGHIGCSLPRSPGPSTRSGDLEINQKRLYLKNVRCSINKVMSIMNNLKFSVCTSNK